MRNGFRKWNVSSPTNEKAFKFLPFNVLEGISKAQIFSSLGILLTFISTYFNFLGYSIVKSRLETLGFDSVSIDSVSFDNIYQSIIGLSPGLISLFSEESFFSFAWQLLVLVVLVAFLPWFVLLGVKISGTKCFQKIKKSKLINEKRFNRYLASRLTILLSLGTIAGYVYFLSILIFLISMIFLFSAIGISLGNQQAKEILAKEVCEPVEQVSISYVGCRELTTNSGKNLVGIRLYKNSEHQYFITNEDVYEFNSDNKVIMSAPICHLVEGTGECKKYNKELEGKSGKTKKI